MLEREQDKLVVHFETLGEYPTFVKRIRLQNEGSHDVVFEALGTVRNSQLHSITFLKGDNPVDLGMTGMESYYRIVTPIGGKSFDIQGETKYRLQVWGKSSRPSETLIEFPR